MLGIVFEPSFLDLSSAGIHETIHNIIIIKCYVDMHKDMYVMYVSGYTALVSWYGSLYAERYHHSSSPGNNDFVLCEYFVWIRWSVFASPSVFQHSLSKQEYIETGPAIINKKCCSLGM